MKTKKTKKAKKHRLDSFVERRAKELGWYAPHPAHALIDKPIKWSKGNAKKKGKKA